MTAGQERDGLAERRGTEVQGGRRRPEARLPRDGRVKAEVGVLHWSTIHATLIQEHHLLLATHLVSPVVAIRS